MAGRSRAICPWSAEESRSGKRFDISTEEEIAEPIHPKNGTDEVCESKLSPKGFRPNLEEKFRRAGSATRGGGKLR